MDKYGVLHEYRCACGYCLVRRDNEPQAEVIKEASIDPQGVEHLHELKEVDENGRGPDPSTNVRSR